jgi:hypothetical protein
VKGQVGQLVMADWSGPGEIEAAELVDHVAAHIHVQKGLIQAVLTTAEEAEIGLAPASTQGGAAAAVERADRPHYSTPSSKAAIASPT